METKILGAYAEYIAVPAHIIAQNAYHKPSHLSYEAAAFLEPLACVVHAQRQLAARPGDSIAIVGTGGFGILHALVARALGGTPILIGRHPERLAFAKRLGIATVVDSNVRDPATAVLARTLGRGADAAIESTGAADVWEAAPALVRRGGTVVLFGGLPGGTRVTYDAARLHYDEVKLISPFHFTPRAVRQAYGLLASHEVDVEPLISERFALADLATAFRKLAEGTGLKFALIP